jgi:hypothetical protein
MDLEQLKKLAGIYSNSPKPIMAGSNISVTAAEKARIMRDRDIQPGTPEWFQLWFSLPFLTGEKPTGPTQHR